jgi:hypothetical protein
MSTPMPRSDPAEVEHVLVADAQQTREDQP